MSNHGSQARPSATGSRRHHHHEAATHTSHFPEDDMQRDLGSARRSILDCNASQESDTVDPLPASSRAKPWAPRYSMWVKNQDARPGSVPEMAKKFRPSHADYTYQAKYGVRDWQGGGRSSARETVGRVAAGAIAKKLLRERHGVEVLAYVRQVHRLKAEVDPVTVRFKEVEANIVRCPDAAVAPRMIRRIERARNDGDTVGGIIEGVARGVPPGWGEPVFDRLEAQSRQSHVESAGHERIRDRLRVRLREPDRPRTQRPLPQTGRPGSRSTTAGRAARDRLGAGPCRTPATSGPWNGRDARALPSGQYVRIPGRAHAGERTHDCRLGARGPEGFVAAVLPEPDPDVYLTAAFNPTDELAPRSLSPR